MEIFLDRVEFHDFKSYTKTETESEALRALTIHNGYLSAHVHPSMGENEDDRGTYDVPTPIARMREVRLRDADVTLNNEGMMFKVRVNSADLTAFNEPYQGDKNSITGQIVVDGKTYTLLSEDLDPEYDQQTFDASYVCNDDLRSLVPPF